MIKQIVCLANSRKINGRCIAGKELGDTGAWIRPVSARLHEEVSEHERQYEDGSDPRVLDVIEIPMLQPKPGKFQRENWLLDSQYYWVKKDTLKANDLMNFVDNPPTLWVNRHSSYNGANDRIPLAVADNLTNSLELIFVEQLSLNVFAPGETFGNKKRRVQADFSYNGDLYKLWVTDPKIERSYLQQDNGTYPLDSSYLCISLSEPYDEYCYKLVATIISA